VDRLPFRKVYGVDFEFSCPDGERPAVRCMTAREFRTGEEILLWLDDVPPPPSPFPPDALVVAYFASAEMGCFLALGWEMPAHVLDLYVEFKWMTCGKDGANPYPKLIYALDWFGLESISASEKKEMQNLAIRGGPYTGDERRALLDYCMSDVDALARLLPRMLPRIDLPRAVLRGGFMRTVARMERNGIPVDGATLAQLDEHWESLQQDMIDRIDADYGVYEGIHFRTERFAYWLARNGISWRRLASGALDLEDETFKTMAEIHPVLRPQRQLRQAMALLRLTDLPVGADGRNRCLLSPFGTITGRFSNKSSKFIFGRPAWMRCLIRPEEGRALAYLDWSGREYGIGAVLSGDEAMTADYQSGDPYLRFAERIGMTPPGATKKTHSAEREVVKAVILGTQYGMGEWSLAARIGQPLAYARALLHEHRAIYRRFWAWNDAAVNTALFRGRLWTRSAGRRSRTTRPRRTRTATPTSGRCRTSPARATARRCCGWRPASPATPASCWTPRSMTLCSSRPPTARSSTRSTGPAGRWTGRPSWCCPASGCAPTARSSGGPAVTATTAARRSSTG
jgi:hypothetical protein